MSKATGTPKRLLAASADSRRVVDSAVISKSSESDFRAGMCACAAHPRSGLAPMMPTRIFLAASLVIAIRPNPHFGFLRSIFLGIYLRQGLGCARVSRAGGTRFRGID